MHTVLPTILLPTIFQKNRQNKNTCDSYCRAIDANLYYGQYIVVVFFDAISDNLTVIIDVIEALI